MTVEVGSNGVPLYSYDDHGNEIQVTPSDKVGSREDSLHNAAEFKHGHVPLEAPKPNPTQPVTPQVNLNDLPASLTNQAEAPLEPEVIVRPLKSQGSTQPVPQQVNHSDLPDPLRNQADAPLGDQSTTVHDDETGSQGQRSRSSSVSSSASSSVSSSGISTGSDRSDFEIVNPNDAKPPQPLPAAGKGEAQKHFEGLAMRDKFAKMQRDSAIFNTRKDIAKKELGYKVGNLLVNVSLTAVAVPVTIFSLGLASPLLVISAGNLMLAIGDTGCSIYDVASRQQGNDGASLHGDSLGTLLNRIFTKFNIKDPEKRLELADKISAGIRIALGGLTIMGDLYKPNIPKMMKKNGLTLVEKDKINAWQKNKNFELVERENLEVEGEEHENDDELLRLSMHRARSRSTVSESGSDSGFNASSHSNSPRPAASPQPAQPVPITSSYDDLTRLPTETHEQWLHRVMSGAADEPVIEDITEAVPDDDSVSDSELNEEEMAARLAELRS